MSILKILGSCSKQGYDSVRPKSGYKRRSHTISNHDNNVDMKEDQSPNDRAMLEGYGNEIFLIICRVGYH